jgi:hypothetical protein
MPIVNRSWHTDLDYGSYRLPNLEIGLMAVWPVDRECLLLRGTWSRLWSIQRSAYAQSLICISYKTYEIDYCSLFCHFMNQLVGVCTFMKKMLYCIKGSLQPVRNSDFDVKVLPSLVNIHNRYFSSLIPFLDLGIYILMKKGTSKYSIFPFTVSFLLYFFWNWHGFYLKL